MNAPDPAAALVEPDAGAAPESAELIESQRRPGRPRSEARSQEILDATLEALVQEGFGAMTMEGIAARAGAGKATLYRRWPSKAELVADAVQQHVCAEVPIVDTGDVRRDVCTFLRAMQESVSGLDGALFFAFTAERIRHPDLAAAFDRQFVATRRTALRKLIRGGVDRGELPRDTDVELLADVGPAMILYVFTKQRRLPHDLVDRIVEQFFPA
jgi:AcrR family transcriptional regulator